MIAEARAGLEVLRAEATAPAGLDGVKRVVGQRFSIWRPRERPEGEWAAFWADYVEVLGELPMSALEGGMRAWIKNGATRLPYPGELLPLAKAAVTAEAMAYERAVKVAALAAPEPVDVRAEPVDPVVTARSLASFKTEMAARQDVAHRSRMRRPAWMNDQQWRDAQTVSVTRRPERPPVSAPVGETGVSEELLDQVYGNPDREGVQA